MHNVWFQKAAKDTNSVAARNSFGRIHRELREKKLRARLILQVHDELVLEVPRDEVEPAAQIVREGMEQAYPLRVPLVAEVAVGPNWRDMDEIRG